MAAKPALPEPSSEASETISVSAVREALSAYVGRVTLGFAVGRERRLILCRRCHVSLVSVPELYGRA